MESLNKAIKFLGINRSMAGMLGMVVLIGMGERLAERFLPVYLMALGASALIPGFFNGLTNLLSAVYSYPGGWLSEKIGYKRSLLVFNLIAMLGYAIVVLIPSWVAVIIGSFFFLSWSALSLPATMELVSKVLPKNKQTMGVSMHSLIRRFPMALGPILGGILIDAYGIKDGVRIAFSIAIMLGIISIIMQQRLIAGDSTKKNSENSGLWATITAMPKSLRVLLLSDTLIRFCEQIPYAYLAIWAMDHTLGAHISAKEFGLLTAIEMAVAVLVYIPVAWLADRGSKKTIISITFFNFTMFPLILDYSTTFMMLAIAFIVRGLKEFGEPTRKSLIIDLAPEGSKASTFGAYYLIRDVIVSVSCLAGAYLWQMSPGINFAVSFAFGVLGTLVFVIYGKD